jgi:hypothetical protein
LFGVTQRRDDSHPPRQWHYTRFAILEIGPGSTSSKNIVNRSQLKSFWKVLDFSELPWSKLIRNSQIVEGKSAFKSTGADNAA